MKKTYVATREEIVAALHSLGWEQKTRNIKFIGGISNENFLIDGQVVLRLPFSSAPCRSSDFPAQMTEWAAKYGLGPQLLAYKKDTGIQLTGYLKNYQAVKFDVCERATLVKIIETVKAIHRFKPDNKEYLDYYGDIEKKLKSHPTVTELIPEKHIWTFLDRFRPLYTELMAESVPSHLDLVSSNILIGPDIKIIDFEYAAYTFEYFDLVSILSENEMRPETRRNLIDIYFTDQTAKEKFLSRYAEIQRALDLYWCLWGLSRQTGLPSKDQAFLTIAKAKAESFRTSETAL